MAGLKRRCSFLYILIFMSFHVPSSLAKENFDDLPRILTQDGNLIFVPALNSSVIFHSETGKAINLTALYKKVQASDAKLQKWEGNIQTLERKFQTWEGKLQEWEIKLQALDQLLQDKCESAPCKNGGSCTRNIGSFSCKCTSQWKGPTCEEDVDECSDLNTCKNGGICINKPGTFRCVCPAYWTGEVCDVQAKQCGDFVCYHGNCSQPENTASRSGLFCECDNGYTGTECQSKINHCSLNPCQNGGQCLSSVTGFICMCTDGYFGSTCEGNYGNCSSNEFQCEAFPDQCVSTTVLCDGKYDCGDGSDEFRCCGGRYSGVSGFIRSPIYQFTTDSCTWKIEVPAKNHIQLNVLNFQMARQNCLHLYDSANTSSQTLLTVLCGIEDTLSFNSAANVMTVVLQPNDHLLAFESFEAQYTAIPSTPSSSCGDIREDDNGIITSPDFPDRTKGKVSCNWKIEAPHGHQILLNITEFYIKQSGGCLGGSLKIRNGVYADSPLIDQYCGLKPIPAIYSHSNTLSLTFEINDDDIQGKLRLTYSFMASGCGAEMTEPSDTFTSPGYPDSPINDIECYWDIVLAKGSTIKLTFPVMNINVATGNCTANTGNYVQIMEPSMKVIQTLCGNTTPPEIVSSSNWLIIKYIFTKNGINNQQTTGTGFLATYSTECHSELSGWRGVIESPNFPSFYPSNLNCTWVVKSKPHTVINFAFSHFEVTGITAHCEHDFLLIQTRNTSRKNLIGRYCGFDLPPSINTTSNEVLLTFATSATRSSTGFRLEYVHIGCGGELTQQNGLLSTSDLHVRYCYWTITVDPTMSINLTMEDFGHSGGHSCDRESVEIEDGVKNTSMVCDSTHTFISAGNKVTVTYKNTNGSGSGFNAHYQAIKGCGGNFLTGSGDIVSAGYPANYTKFIECDWFITVPHGRVILTIEDLDMELSRSCIFDSVKVYDGPDSTFPLLQTFCGRQLPTSNIINSTSSQMFIRMVSNGNAVYGKGFSAKYKTGFGGVIFVGGPGVITSPHFGRMASDVIDNSTASWVLSTVASDKIILTFSSIYLNKFGGVCKGWVEVRNGYNSDAPSVGRFCGTTAPRPITSRGSMLFVNFHGSNENGNRGFRAEYSRLSSGCGGTFIAPNGTIVSPGYPDSFPKNVECIWTIQGSPGSEINLQFTTISFPSSYWYSSYKLDCQKSFLEVREDDQNGRLISKFCQTADVNNIETVKHSSVWIRFVATYASTRNTSFVLKYFTVYGGYISGTSGQIDSPFYPEPAPHPSHIKWTIMTVQEGKVIQANFTNLGNSLGCTGGVSIRNINDVMASPVVYDDQRYLCSFLSDTNEVEIKFDSDYHDVGRGFRLYWTSVLPAAQLPVVEDLDAVESIRNFTNTMNKIWQYSSNQIETWRITAPYGYKVWLNITVIAMEFSTNCMADVLTVYDDSTTTRSKKLGHFCGNEGNDGILLSTRSVMTVQFLSDVSINNQGFVAEYKAVCGTLFESSEGVIESPGYPHNYPTNTKCVWKISMKRGYTIQLEFNKTFNMISSNTSACEQDYVMIKNGGSAWSPALGPNPNGRFCGNQAQSLNESTSHTVYVEFNSDANANEVASGFQLNFSRVQVTCGGHIQLTETGISSGDIASPGTGYQTMSVECIWVITAPPHRSIQLDFESFNLANNCQKTFLELHDGSTQNSPKIWQKCGKQTISTVKSTGNALFVLFWSNDIQRYSFKAKYQLGQCGGTFYNSQGFFIYPTPLYKIDADCEWFIVGPMFHILEFNITITGDNEQRGTGHLQIGESRDIINFDTPLYPPFGHYVVPSNSGYLHLQTNESITLKVDYQSVLEECGGYLENPGSLFHSPNYPDVYSHMQHCVWIIKVLPGRRISLSFLNFQLEKHVNCNYDYLEVYDGLLDDSRKLGRYCGESVPTVIQSSQNTMRVVFKSDISRNYTGFRAEYSSNSDAVCGGALSDLNGTITFPEFIMENNTGVDCVWTIQLPTTSAASTVKINVTHFLLSDNSHNCSEEFLEIREGADENGGLMARLCGNFTGNDTMYAVIGTDVWIRLRTNGSHVSEGFNLTYETYSCGGIHQQTSSAISPGYRRSGSNTITCAWLIKLPEGEQVELLLQDIRLSYYYNNNCTSSYLKVLNGGSQTSPEIGKYCSRTNNGQKLISSENMMRLLFYSDWHNSWRVFRLKYKAHTAGCGGIYHGINGSLSNPNYRGSTVCEWDIYVSTSHHVILNINSLDMTSQYSCQYAYLQITELLTNGTTVTLAKLCGKKSNMTIKSSGEHMHITQRTSYSSSRNLNGNSISAAWTSSCGEMYTNQSGLIVSPGYPDSYTNNLICNYTIVPDGAQHKTVIVEFIHFDLQETCKDSLYNVDKNIHICGNTLPNPITSEGSLNLQFRTDGSDVGQGFIARYWVSDCGGLYNDPSGLIKSPTHPLNYGQPFNCTWVIKVVNRSVRLKFQKFGFQDCDQNYLEIRDGSNQTSPLIGRYCGHQFPDPIITSTNIMSVHLVTESVGALASFQALYTSVIGEAQGCGGTQEGTGSLRSPDLSGNSKYENNLDCFWIISVGEGNTVKLTIPKIELEKYGYNKRFDYLEIYDGLRKTDPVLGSYSNSSSSVTVLNSTSNTMSVYFHTDSSIVYSGFIAIYNEISGKSRK